MFTVGVRVPTSVVANNTLEDIEGTLLFVIVNSCFLEVINDCLRWYSERYHKILTI